MDTREDWFRRRCPLCRMIFRRELLLLFREGLDDEGNIVQRCPNCRLLSRFDHWLYSSITSEARPIWATVGDPRPKPEHAPTLEEEEDESGLPRGGGGGGDSPAMLCNLSEVFD